ncbi:type II secretion system protein [Halorientalis pallida]|uniref:Type II secretion system protein n=1 Tax=Halorientalis pallida TaxID=2479928 RepID=A0A498KU38_9EURY|nr:type II secretion system protein [Halorientalis pallida]RXK48482.1 type II secretion system protein [Halorientalis pallida]
MKTDIEWVVRLLAQCYPWPAEGSADLDRSLGFLGSDLCPETVVRAGYGAGLLCVPAVVLAGAVAPAGTVALALGSGAAGALAVVHAVHTAPHALATARRTRALGEAPALVSRAVLRMRVTPATETAAAFAAETGQGPLADSLGEHVRRAAGSAGSGFPSFTAEWDEWFPALRRALLLVESAGTAPDGERERALDRGMAAVLDGTRDRMAEFASGLQGPATGLYAFGVLLPLAMVAMLPAVRTAGASVPLAAVVVLYDFTLPAVLLAASAWLLIRRPVTFPPPSVGREHPDVPSRRWPALATGLAAGATGWVLARGLVAPWTGPLAAAGGACGAALVVSYRPITTVRERVRAVEDGLADALYQIGRRVEEGEAVERAVAAAGEEVADPTGAVLREAAQRQRRLKIGVREAFLGEHGALADVPSPRARSTATLLALAASEGRPAGGAIVAMADNVEELAGVERDARHEIGTVTGTLANTAALFGPLVAGATVALAAGMDVGGTFAVGAAGASGTAATAGTASGPSTAGLGLAVGAYVLVLAVILTTLSTGLAHGLDRALVGYRVGWALLVATATYMAAIHAVGLFV